MGPIYRDFFVKKQPIWAARPRIPYPPRETVVALALIFFSGGGVGWGEGANGGKVFGGKTQVVWTL